nr:ERF family protein [Streptococcus urinalis]
MNKSESISALSKALVKTQKEMKQPLKDANNPFFKSKYVPLENVVESVIESASKNGLAFTQYPSQDENGLVTVGTIMLHDSGEYMEFPPIKVKPVKNDPQAIGSAITYSKRYALSAIFGITSDQDDDGNEASKPVKKQQSSQQQNQRISKELVKAYEDNIQKVVEIIGKHDGSIMRWFLENLKVAKIEQITVNQQQEADKLINDLIKGANKNGH